MAAHFWLGAWQISRCLMQRIRSVRSLNRTLRTLKMVVHWPAIFTGLRFQASLLAHSPDGMDASFDQCHQRVHHHATCAGETPRSERAAAAARCRDYFCATCRAIRSSESEKSPTTSSSGINFSLRFNFGAMTTSSTLMNNYGAGQPSPR